MQLVLFSQWQGRFSTRNRMVAELIQKQNIGTLLFDVFTEEEDKFTKIDSTLIYWCRLIETTEWLMDYNEVRVCPLAILEQVQVRLGNTSGGLFWKHYKQ
jgi:hypothetical protein